jgi:hypothetical protein
VRRHLVHVFDNTRGKWMDSEGQDMKRPYTLQNFRETGCQGGRGYRGKGCGAGGGGKTRKQILRLQKI